MRLIGFTFTKVGAQRDDEPKGGIKVSSKIEFLSLKKRDLDFFNSKEELIEAKFRQIIDYSPDFAKIEFEGNILIALDSKTAKDVLKKWKDKDVPADVKTFMFNIVLKKSSVKALELEDELNLPTHIKLPQVSLEA